jgi:hypothetical protein
MASTRPTRSARPSTAQIRTAVFGRVRAAGPEYAMLAAFVAIGANLIDLASLPLPGAGSNGGFLAATIIRIVAIFYATYAILRRMAGTPAPFRPAAGLARFAALALPLAMASGLVTAGGARLLGGSDMDLASRWLLTLVLAAAWGVVMIRLVGVPAVLANGAPFRALPANFRRLRGCGVRLALVFLQLVLPFAAVHLALTLIGAALPLPGGALAALALVDGVVSAIQLLLTCALAVTAMRIAADRASDPAGALRDAPAGG